MRLTYPRQRQYRPQDGLHQATLHQVGECIQHGKLGTRHKCFPHRAARQGRARGFQMAQILRLAAHQLDIGDMLLGIGAPTAFPGWVRPGTGC